MSEITKQDNRVMGDYSIAKSFKGILRIAHILELVKNEKDTYFNPTYYGKPTKLLNISGGAYDSSEIGYANPSQGLDGTVQRYVSDDSLKNQRVPMTDSMGNYLNWNIGYDGVTIGSDESINSTSIELEKFKQNNVLGKETEGFIWQQKNFPILEAGRIVIGLQNKEYPSDKYRVNKESGLVIENRKNIGKLIIQNRYDKSNVSESCSLTHTFKNYQSDDTKVYRTIYQDDNDTIQDYDVFMYKQDDYDCDNYEYTKQDSTITDDVRSKKNELIKLDFTNNGNTWVPKKTVIDCNVKITNLKNYVQSIIQKYMQTPLVEVPSGTIINQFCSLKKWYAYPDNGDSDELLTNDGELLGNSFPGHRPAMMAKRDVDIKNTTDSNNAFIQSTILGACKDINRLLNTNYDYTNKDNYGTEGYYKEIIPLYKRDYVLCDGSVYAIWAFPRNLISNYYPNRRESFERFINLFFAIGYEYTTKKEYVNRRFNYEWFDGSDEISPAYKIIRANAKPTDNKTKGEHLVNFKNCQFFLGDNGSGTLNTNIKGDGYPSVGEYPDYLYTDKNALFVEDFLTLLAFEAIYEFYGKVDVKEFTWNNTNLNNWMKTVKIPEKYSLNTFIGDSNETIREGLKNDIWAKKTGDFDTEIQNGNFVIELPYYNFINDGSEEATTEKIGSMPMVMLGREVKTFGDPIKFWDATTSKWTIVEAYKIPQIQYIIDLFSLAPTPDTLAGALHTFYQYNFQVPNLCGNIPTFIGSSGTQWADHNFRKIREPESWTSNYSQYNYAHRHFVFLEPIGGNDSYNTEENYDNFSTSKVNGPRGSWMQNGAKPYYGGTVITENPDSYVSCTNYFGGNASSEEVYKTGESGHINYIWNELGADENIKKSNIVLENELLTVNGMSYPVFQISKDGVVWTTGKHRFTRASHENDLIMTQSQESYTTNGVPWWNKGNAEHLQEDRDNKLKYEQETGWYGWEHPEDPRFDSAEPNRGRTSKAVDQTVFTNTLNYVRYERNQEVFNITLDPTVKEAEWFSPENIKMLPLIKL